MATPTLTPGAGGFSFGRNIGLLNQSASVGFRISSALAPDVLAALRSSTDPFPARDIELAEIGLEASTSQPIEFGRGADKISFTAAGSVFAGLGIYRSGAALLAKLGEGADDFDLSAPELGSDPQSLLAVLRWGYAAEGKASGAMALGAVGAATLSVAGNREGLFAVIRRLPASSAARAVVQETADSWLLPRQIATIDQVPPGTWIVSEVIGGISVTLGAQLGYDFNWVREARLGGLTGDIGLRLQMGINAAVGYSASGRCAVLVSRDSTDRALRLRYFRLKTRALDLSLNARLSVQAIDTLLPDKIDDFIAAVFDTHGQQIVRGIEVLERWTDPEKKLTELLAEAGVDGAERLIAHLAGVTPGELQEKFDAVHDTAVAFIGRWRALPHTVSSTLLKLVEERADLAEVRAIAQQLSTITTDGLRALLATQLARIDFFHTPAGRFLESAVEGGVLRLLEQPLGEVQRLGGLALGVLDGSLVEQTLVRFQRFVETELHLDRVFDVVTNTDFAALDALLKRRLADFLGQDTLVFEDLEKVRGAIRLLLAKREEYYEKALEALHRKYNFSLNDAWQSTTTGQALLDATFDFSRDPGAVAGFFQQAVQGRLDNLFLQQPPQVRIAAGRLSHGVTRQTSIDVSLPFMDRTHVHVNESLALLDVVPNGGGLLFKLAASDTVASNQRKGILSLTMGLSRSDPKSGVRVHQDSLEMNYSLLFAKRDMRLKDVRAQIEPMAATVFATRIPDLDRFLDLLDRQTEEAIPNGPNKLGNGLISLNVSLSNRTAINVGKAWMSLPADRKADVYLELSRAIQTALKKNVHDAVFSSADDYKRAIVTAQTVLAYCAIETRTPRVTGRLDLPFWDFADPAERRAMLNRPQTVTQLRARLEHAQHLLGDDSAASFFEPADAARILGRVDASAPLLQALLFAEAEVIRHAFEGGVAIAMSMNAAPSDAVKALATFGAKLTEAFNSQITTLLGPGIQALGTRVFLAASRAIDPTRAPEIAEASAMLNLEFLKPESRFDGPALLAAGHVPADQLAFADRVVELSV
jgi:hypothetical protein